MSDVSAGGSGVRPHPIPCTSNPQPFTVFIQLPTRGRAGRLSRRRHLSPPYDQSPTQIYRPHPGPFHSYRSSLAPKGDYDIDIYDGWEVAGQMLPAAPLSLRQSQPNYSPPPSSARRRRRKSGTRRAARGRDPHSLYIPPQSRSRGLEERTLEGCIISYRDDSLAPLQNGPMCVSHYPTQCVVHTGRAAWDCSRRPWANHMTTM